MFTFAFVAQHHHQFLRFVRDDSVVVVKDNLLDMLAPESLLIQTASLHNETAIISPILSSRLGNAVGKAKTISHDVYKRLLEMH